ncbi:hypothetical protein H8S90_15500 [Olivibacter sp. SDN3]|uniref:hypothetical protein n=1 Tax=Olivibacter sp. SDN3 TaxID=2764720 RepID=UPI001650D6DB|nr:hypothetical protein [Olivibacter sp. SDN3]QNL48202.1 hypothetical protein H8S90_15500 [Olivibacter sp. SDN3]
MFFRVEQFEEAVFETESLANPIAPANAMVLVFYRTWLGTAICNAYSKKPRGEYWDTVQKRKIARRHWTPAMRTFHDEKITAVPRAPYTFKFTIFGYIFILAIIAFFAYLTYDSTKPPLPKSREAIAMEEAINVGDVFFGHLEAFKVKGDPLGARVRFGWFKVVSVEQDTFFIAPAREMNKVYKAKETLNSTDFEEESTPALIKTRETYSIRMLSVDEKTEYYFDSKK